MRRERASRTTDIPHTHKTYVEYIAVLQDLQQSMGLSILVSTITDRLTGFFTVVITSPISWNFWMVMGLALSSCAVSYHLLHRSIWISHIVLIAVSKKSIFHRKIDTARA